MLDSQYNAHGEELFFNNNIDEYLSNLRNAFSSKSKRMIYELAKEIKKTWLNKKSIFICGNGGSGANAIHMANDFLYGVGVDNNGMKIKSGLKVEALTANNAVITCLANDIGYDFIFSEQINTKAEKDDILLVLSGSGNSKNILNAVNLANQNGLKTFAILGFKGGKCKKIVQNPIHFEINNMRISEDLQMIVCNILVEWLNNNYFDNEKK